MKLITKEWIDKAEGDWGSAQRDARARKNPNFDGACYHAQQCVEKYLKARLQEAGVQFKKTHDLEKLLELLLPLEPSWDSLQADLAFLKDFAVDYRYPGARATKARAKDALKSCRRVRQVIRAAFGLPI